MKLVSLENLLKYNELLNQKTVRSVNSVKPDSTGNVTLGTEKSTFNKVEFDTGYFSIGTNAKYEFDLTGSDLENVSKENVNIRIVAKVTTAHSGFEVGDIAQLTTTVDDTASPGVTYDLCTYISGNTLYVYSSNHRNIPVNSGTGWLLKTNVQIKAVLTAFIPDDGSILLIAEDQNNSSKLIGLPDGTLTWKDKNLVRSVNGVDADENGNVTISSLIPNQIIQSPVPLTDANLHLLDGALLSGDGAYADYVAMMGSLHDADPTANCWTTESDWQTSVSTYGECGKFVYDSVNNTLRLPKLKSFIQATNSANELGSLVEAGLPNIEGYIGVVNHLPNTASGAFQERAANDKTLDATVNANTGVFFDASLSNPIYSNSDTVQPQAIKYYFYIVVGTVSKTDIQVNIDNIMTDLNGKADKDLSNVTAPTQAFKNMSIGWAVPDYNAGIVLADNTDKIIDYIMPADGYLYISISIWSNSIGKIFVNDTIVNTVQSPWDGQSQQCTQFILLVKKDDVIKFSYNNNFMNQSHHDAHFFPFKGAN